MSVIGIGSIWVFAVVVFMVITRWPMGKESDHRAAYWSKYDDK
jgi:hypothetical protein